MFGAYVVVSLVLSAYLAFSATLDFVRYKQVLFAMARGGVPESWLPLLGILKGVGGLGLLVGIGVPLVGTAAAIGVVLFFVAAFIVHLRAHYYSLSQARFSHWLWPHSYWDWRAWTCWVTTATWSSEGACDRRAGDPRQRSANEHLQ